MRPIRLYSKGGKGPYIRTLIARKKTGTSIYLAKSLKNIWADVKNLEDQIEYTKVRLGKELSNYPNSHYSTIPIGARPLSS